MKALFSSQNVEHYTPTDILRPVIVCLGAIDLDPCSNSHERPHVPAARHYTQTDDGLRQCWQGRVFMNPPYARDITDKWVLKLCRAYRAGTVTEAIALVAARTDTQWFQPFWEYPLCFVTGRLCFINNKNSAGFPSVLAYLGNDLEKFYQHFAPLGRVVRALPDARQLLELPFPSFDPTTAFLRPDEGPPIS